MRTSEMNENKIASYAKILEETTLVHFSYNEFYYEVFESVDTGYIVNVYGNDEKDEDGDYLEKNILDGGLCTGSPRDAIEFML